MKLTSLLSRIQQAGAPETTAKSVTPCSYFWLFIIRGLHKFIFHKGQTSTRS